MKSKVFFQSPKTLPHLSPFNMYNIQKNQNLKTHAPQKGEKKKCQFNFFRPVLALKTVDFEVLLNYKVLDLQVLFLKPQESI